MDLLIGCGSRRQRKICPNGRKEWDGLVTLDNNPAHNPDHLSDIADLPLNFPDNHFDEIHAYEVLEHLADQGDYEFFFREFSEYWRILKPGGLFCASAPDINSKWLWGDPSHRRVICGPTLTFLSQAEYNKQVGVTSMSDFRHIYKADFIVRHKEVQGDSFYFILEAIKLNEVIND